MNLKGFGLLWRVHRRAENVALLKLGWLCCSATSLAFHMVPRAIWCSTLNSNRYCLLLFISEASLFVLKSSPVPFVVEVFSFSEN